METAMESQDMAVNKMSILNLLTDAEVAKVSNAEDGVELAEGDSFVDLDHPEDGVQTAEDMSEGELSHVIPQSAVSPQTWDKIVAHLGG
jgi:hypothetical protein